jgi:hypothetical protein
MPYRFKKQVLEAMIVSSLLYACESWLTVNVKEIEKMYISALKSLLGVRETTRSDTIFIESGMPTVSERIFKITAKFVKKELLVEQVDRTPLQKVFDICKMKRTRGYKFMSKLLLPTETQPSVLEKFVNESGTKAETYRTLNPELKVHPVYASAEYIDERARIAFTRLRLSSHSLKIETGRWSRIDREERLCGCGLAVENEEHVLLECPKTESVREKFHIDTALVNDMGLLMDSVDVKVLIPFVDCCLRIFK